MIVLLHIGSWGLAFLLHAFLYYFAAVGFWRAVIGTIVTIISARIAWVFCREFFEEQETVLLGIANAYLFIIVPIILLLRAFFVVIGF